MLVFKITSGCSSQGGSTRGEDGPAAGGPSSELGMGVGAVVLGGAAGAVVAAVGAAAWVGRGAAAACGPTIVVKATAVLAKPLMPEI